MCGTKKLKSGMEWVVWMNPFRKIMFIYKNYWTASIVKY